MLFLLVSKLAWDLLFGITDLLKITSCLFNVIKKYLVLKIE